MRTLAALLLLGIAAAPTPATVDSLAPDAEARWTPFDLTPGNQIVFAAMLDGRPVRAVLDTGVSSSVLSSSYAARAGLRVRPGVAAQAIGGAVANGWSDVARLEVGALTRSGGRMAVVALPVAATGGMPVDVLVGRDVTAGFALDIDYDLHRFRLLPSGRLPFRGDVAPLRIAGVFPGYVSEIAIAGHRIDRVMVDTGDGAALTLSRPTWNALPPPHPRTTSTVAYGIGGATEAELAIVPQVRSGLAPPRDVETRIERPGGYTESIGMRARIGSGFFAGARVLLDPGAARMVVAPSAGVDRPPVRSTSGLLLRAEPGRLVVLHVMRGGPAATAGWRAGETICRVDGEAVSAAAIMRWPVEAPGRLVHLGLCDGTERSLTLRTFY